MSVTVWIGRCRVRLCVPRYPEHKCYCPDTNVDRHELTCCCFALPNTMLHARHLTCLQNAVASGNDQRISTGNNQKACEHRKSVRPLNGLRLKRRWARADNLASLLHIIYLGQTQTYAKTPYPKKYRYNHPTSTSPVRRSAVP